MLAWSYIGAYHLHEPLQIYVPIFGLIGVASMIAACGFFLYRRQRPYIGASSLGFGFLFWGCYLVSYPFLLASEELTATAFFLSTVVQLFIAVSMIILVLEQLRFLNQRRSHQEICRQQKQKELLQTKMISTEERYRNLFEQASEAIVIAAASDLRILELNQAAEYLLGISRAEAPQHSLSAFCRIEGPAAPQTSREWFELLRHRTLSLVRKDGSLVMSESSGASTDFAGQPAYQFFFREVTERSRLEQQLRHADRLSSLGQMLSGVAHELNNPLAVIKGYLELVLMHHELPDKTRVDLQKVAQESNRAAKLVQNFLAYARERVPHREMFDLNASIQRVTELRKFDFDRLKVEARLTLDPLLSRTHADPDQIQQVLVILVSNALQAMAEANRPGILKISTQQTTQSIRVLIEDNGPGVPKHLEGKIFEPFYATKKAGKGTGLALSLHHTILCEHQGTICFQKSSLGGAGFVLELPVVKVAEDIPTPAPKPDDSHAEAELLPSAKILVLDDAQRHDLLRGCGCARTHRPPGI
ncbi:MAG: hypothetical protein DME26_02770 [Verrucomicrobia bacterium]|nr:MAG: hypothetical protein DME26_02770 [Verrucomicrobiota bacterium]